jgi:DNA-binding LacI/PurR family transcriptional regulator
VSGPGGWFDSQGRLAGWQQALTEAGAEVPPVIPADWQAASGYRAGQILGRIPEVSAVFAASDHLALGILRALHECGRRVPDDVGVAGFGDVPEAAYLTPPLTTVRPDYTAVAAAGIDLLLAQIRAGHRIDDRRVIEPELITRASVTSPRALRARQAGRMVVTTRRLQPYGGRNYRPGVSPAARGVRLR